MTLRGIIDSILGLVRPQFCGSEAPEKRQVGAVPYTLVEGRVVYLIITSRRTGRWIFPKGDPMEGRAPWEAAAQEAYEEAGVRGEIEQQPVGSYVTVKTTDMRRRMLNVELYPMRLTEQLEEWPEKGQRHRHWVTLTDARRLLSDPNLVEIVERIDARELAAKT